MLLVAVATENEIAPLGQFLAAAPGIDLLVTGMGPVAAAASLSSYLALHASRCRGVLNIGVGGAYLDCGIQMLDICLAHREILGDFGICMQNEIRDFDHGLIGPNAPLLFDNDLVERVEAVLTGNNMAYQATNFVTVNCATGTRERGEFLRTKFNAGCENMEGAAVAVVCRNFTVPCAELRCISNMVADRNTADWRLAEAVAKMCRVAGVVLDGLLQD